MSLSIDEVGQFLSSPVPRIVTPAIKRQILNGPTGIIFYFIGGMFCFLGSVFLFLFFPWNIQQELKLDTGKISNTSGIITEVKTTGMKVNNSTVYILQYKFKTAGGKQGKGKCYSFGYHYKQGQRAKIEYLSSDPGISRIQGCYINAMGYWGLFSLLFPLVGFGMIFFTWLSRKQKIELLQNGSFALGLITAVTATNMRVNNQQRYKVTVSFDFDGLSQTSSYFAYGRDVNLAREKLESGENTALLYNPAKPEKVIIAENLLS